jgi:hypothetical protein
MLIVKFKVPRDRQVSEIAAEQIVPGDMVLLKAGDLVTAGRPKRRAIAYLHRSEFIDPVGYRY